VLGSKGGRGQLKRTRSAATRSHTHTHCSHAPPTSACGCLSDLYCVQSKQRASEGSRAYPAGARDTDRDREREKCVCVCG